MEGSIIALIFAIIMIVSHILKSIKEASEAAKLKQNPVKADAADDDLIIIPPKKKQAKAKPRPVGRPSMRDSYSFPDSSFSNRKPSDRQFSERPQALTKKLSPQGVGHRFEADPGTLDPSQIVSPTIDPTVKPDLYSMTGIYEECVLFGDRSKPTIALDIAGCFAKPEGVIQAVILAEILNRPAFAGSLKFAEPGT